MPIKNILIEKNISLDKLIAEFEAEFAQLTRGVKVGFSSLIRKGVPTKEAVLALFDESGYEQLVQGMVDKYGELIKYSVQLGKAVGVPLVLPARSLALIELVKENTLIHFDHLKDAVANNMLDAGLRMEIEGTPLRTIIAELTGDLENIAHKFGAEAHTGASIFDRTIKSEQFKEAGIELFVYVGPNDGKTRDECLEALAAGAVTREDINGLAVSFSGGGGYNCRHEFLPYVEEIDG